MGDAIVKSIVMFAASSSCKARLVTSAVDPCRSNARVQPLNHEPPSPPALLHPFPTIPSRPAFVYTLRLFLCGLAHHPPPSPPNPRLARHGQRHSRLTSHSSLHNVSTTARPVRRRRGGRVLPAVCRRVRPVGQELPPMSLRLPSTLPGHGRCSNAPC